MIPDTHEEEEEEEVSGMDKRDSPACGQTAHAGACCLSCTDRIMAKAILQGFQGQRKKYPRHAPARPMAQPLPTR